MNETHANFCLVLHNHQPIGNFDDVVEHAYRDSYLPFLEVFADVKYEPLKMSLHTSGPLLLWLQECHPEYVDQLRALVAAGRIEILGGPIYEPILPMIPPRDRYGQIRRYTDILEEMFATRIRGMWIPERVWESTLTPDLVRAGIEFIVLDDYHFKAAGWEESQLTGHYLTEDNGAVLNVFPGSERLRYLIPFAPPHQTIEYLRSIAERHPGATLVFGDDGEKFGTWPDTKRHVYDAGWLRAFFDALLANADWLRSSLLGEIVHREPPRGKIYLPDCSYREMTQWALPVERQQRYEQLVQELQHLPQWPELTSYLRGGNWRNFRVRYAEANEMYARMMEVSRRLEGARRTCGDAELLNEIEDHLYRGQCNCPYWHGAFGGLYLPHLRSAIYHHLISADNLLDYLEHGRGQWVDATSEDFDLDLKTEVRVASDQFITYLAPWRGGMMYELDFRPLGHNLLATIQRRPEAYHDKLLQQPPPGGSADDAAGLGESVVCKQQGLGQRLLYDTYPRKSFIEHFFDNDATGAMVSDGKAMERGDFLNQPYVARLRRSASKVQVQMVREGNAWGVPLTITKALTVTAGSPVLEVVYLVEGLPPEREFHLAVEWNFAGMPGGADDRYFYDLYGRSLGELSSRLELADTQHLGLIDAWRGIDVLINLSQPAGIWTMPVQTISQSEGGIEMVHQSVCVMPHWLIRGDAEGRWAVQMQLRITRGRQPCVVAEQVTQTLATPASPPTLQPAP
ncbi:MAG: alpha-amylase [Pirellulaceae bacterium]|nr:MAG: alpha-amylase [Pirellulaceae bacterium]